MPDTDIRFRIWVFNFCLNFQHIGVYQNLFYLNEAVMDFKPQTNNHEASEPTYQTTSWNVIIQNNLSGINKYYHDETRTHNGLVLLKMNTISYNLPYIMNNACD